MNDGNVITVGKVVAGSIWTAVCGLMASGWTLYIWGCIETDTVAASGKQRLAFMLMLTACPLAAAASVAHIRTFAVKMCGLIKAVNGYGPRPVASVPQPREPSHL